MENGKERLLFIVCRYLVWLQEIKKVRRIMWRGGRRPSL